MRTIARVVLTAALVCAVALPAAAQTSARMTDQQIKQQM